MISPGSFKHLKSQQHDEISSPRKSDEDPQFTFKLSKIKERSFSTVKSNVQIVQTKAKQILDIDRFIAESRIQGSSPRELIFVKKISSMLASLDRMQVDAALNALHKICKSPDTMRLIRQRKLEEPLLTLLELCSVKYRNIFINALYFLRFMCIHDLCCYDVVIDGVVKQFPALVRSEDTLLQEMTASVICALFAQFKAEERAIESASLVSLLIELVSLESREVLRHALVTLEDLTYHGANSCFLCRAKRDLIIVLIKHATFNPVNLKRLAMSTIRNIATNFSLYPEIFEAVALAATGKPHAQLVDIFNRARKIEEGETCNEKAERLQLRDETMEVLWFMGSVKTLLHHKSKNNYKLTVRRMTRIMRKGRDKNTELYSNPDDEVILFEEQLNNIVTV